MSPEVTFTQCPNCHNSTYGYHVLRCPYCGGMYCEMCEKLYLANEICPHCNRTIDEFSIKILGIIIPSR